MDSAKEIARDMLEAINVDGTGFLGAVAKGVISFPVSVAYLGYDFMDTEHRRENLDDKFRLAKLIKKVTFNDETIYKVIKPFIDDFVSRVDIPSVGLQIAGSVAGKTLFSQLTGIKLGYVISERATTALFAGTVIGSLLSIGAEASRAIYTSRYLRERNFNVYYKLKNMGDLDLLYFLVEDTVRPFETACSVGEHNPEEFGRICKYFFGEL
ncbi:hypothetical protein PMPD1_2752 [Paramixta manurensis]|uniref:DUF4225 domain-containing protein n=1 Tax=Paramixta manurensis TaxID=2740817 RepID=A0A6M8UIW0_9GAMM|nr:hypothetical protein PMPD1_2752 [Erwiniaceae bacterium PD-1]